MNPVPDAIARLQHSRERWRHTLDQDSRARSARPLGAVSGLLQGLGAQPWQPWLSAASALWLAWRRRRTGPAARPPEPLAAPLAGGTRWRRNVVALSVLAATCVALLWWRRRHRPTPP